VARRERAGERKNAFSGEVSCVAHAVDDRAPGRGLLALVLAGALAVLAVVVWAPNASAAPASEAEIALAHMYSPIVRLKEQPNSCRIGEPYTPTDVDLLMGNDEVALRGPWDRTNIVKVAPRAGDLARGLFGYHLDFPGDTLRPGCTYEQWAARLATAGVPPATYARVVTEAGVPGKLALQYWFFYVYNDWNNKHEGDWEMIQLVFDADTPGQALSRPPVEVGYSQHSSAERAEWGDDKLELVDGTHPVVYPAEGSQANFFGSELYLMRSSAEGVGCDDATGPSLTIRPAVEVVPTARADYLVAYPWLGFDGRWGEKQASVFNGPTGPNDKTQWTRPITWSQESWRNESLSVPGGGALGTRATDVFCGFVAFGGRLLSRTKANPGPTTLVLAVLAVLLVWGLSRTAWRPGRPAPLARQRAWGELTTASWRRLREHPRLFLGIGLLFVPLGALITLIQWLIFRASALTPLVDEAGERNGFVDTLVLSLGVVLTLFGYAVVQAATARALVEIDAGRPVRALRAYRLVAPSLGALLLSLAVAVPVELVLNLSFVLIPVALFLLVRWSLLAVVLGVEHSPGLTALGRSGAVTRMHWWRTATVVFGISGVALLAGPAVGVLTLLFTGAAFDLVNLIAALVYVAALPFAAIVTTYLYFDLAARREAAPAEEPEADELPATI
jgi:hypothetical protein